MELKSGTHRLRHREFALPNVLKQFEDGVPLKGILPRCEIVQSHPAENISFSFSLLKVILNLDQTSILKPENCSQPFATSGG